MKKLDTQFADKSPTRLGELSAELQELEARLRLGGGPDKIEKQHTQGKLTARERMDLLLDKLMERNPQLTVILVYALNIVLTYLVSAFIFAAIFKVLPDARIKWKHVRIGASVTAFLFMGGKFVISYYLGHNTMTSAYGAAGSIIVVLLWVYYSSMILYFGAAFTHSYVVHTGSRIYPNSYAVWVQQIEVESEKSIQQQPETKMVIEVPEKKTETETPVQEKGS